MGQRSAGGQADAGAENHAHDGGHSVALETACYPQLMDPSSLRDERRGVWVLNVLEFGSFKSANGAYGSVVREVSAIHPSVAG